MDKIRLAAKYCGFFCILSNSSLNSSEVLAKYRRKDVIEKSFDDIKNYIYMKRMRTHNTETTDGKLFCAFIGFIVASEIGIKYGKYIKKKSLSKESLIREMEKITIGKDNTGWRLLNQVTKKQREIMNQIGLTEEDHKAYHCQS
jgi:transposase